MGKENFQYGYFCSSCRKKLDLNKNIFFVESGRANYFCKELCVEQYYSPIASHYYEEHLRLRNALDIPHEYFESYAKYISLTIKNPDELWMDRSPFGEEYFFFIGNFSNEGGPFSYVAVSFCIKKEPTFILLSFPTRDKKLLDIYRRGKEIGSESAEISMPVEDGLNVPLEKNNFLDDRSFAIRKEMLELRKKSDIDHSKFEEHSYLLDETIKNPDEAWEFIEGEKMQLTLITQHEESLHYVVVCALENNYSSHIPWKVLYHFPTEDPKLVDRYRRGFSHKFLSPLHIIH